jgi:primary-amine oxidase
LQGGVWEENNAAYGYQLHRNTMGTLHDHVINCVSTVLTLTSSKLTLVVKVDFDIVGVRNSLMAVKLEVEEKEADWIDPVWGEVI